MKRLLVFLTGRHSVIAVLVTLITIDVLLIANAIAPRVMRFLTDRHIFEVVVLTSLLQVIILLSSSLWRQTPAILQTEQDIQEKVKALLNEDPSIQSVRVLSAGLASRHEFLRYLLEMPRALSVEVTACFGKDSPNPDKRDREEFGPGSFARLTHYPKKVKDIDNRLTVWCSHNTPTFRCLILCDSAGARYGFLGWYTYSERNDKICGRGNPQVFVDRTTDAGVALLQFAENKCAYYASPKESVLLFPAPTRETAPST